LNGRDRCWLPLEEKRARRVVDGAFGLAYETTVTS
jgi:hypothetical protein